MHSEELDLFSREEAPILETMRSISSAVPVHHLATIHGKIDALEVVMNLVAGASVVVWRNR